MNQNPDVSLVERESTSISNKKSALGSSEEVTKEKSEIKNDIRQLFNSEENVLSTLESLYKKYTSGMDDITKASSTDLKRTFDDYMGNVEQNFETKIDHSDCKVLRDMFNKFDDKISDVEKAFGGTGENPDDKLPFSVAFLNNTKNDKSLISNQTTWDSFFIKEELKFDFFYFYTILVKLWFGEHIKKKEIEEIQPCKVLITRSLVKRKFDDEIDMR
jgi:hypothetical protein